MPDVIPIDQVRQHMAASRVSIHWFGVRRALTDNQREKAAESFGAEGAFLSAGKRLLNTKAEQFRRLSSIRTQIINYWHSVSVPYPEPGIRLMRRQDIETFNTRMTDYLAQLRQSAVELDSVYDTLKEDAKASLGELYNENDYPTSIGQMFGIEWDFPNVEPPDYLRTLSPSLYEQERRRVANKFEEAVRMTEQAFTTDFRNLVAHLSERLSPTGMGGKKVFRDTAVSNLNEFFERFKSLNITSNEELDKLVSQAQSLVKGITPEDLRNNDSLRSDMSTRLVQVQNSLDALMTDRPRRQIMRSECANESTV